MEKILRILLVEDSKDAVDRFISAAEETDKVEIVAVTGNSPDGERLLSETKPDVVVLDMELSLGSGLDLSEKISRLPENERPYVIVTTVISSPVVYAALHSQGVGYIFNKSHNDYSAEMVIQHILLVGDYIGGFHPKPCGKRIPCCSSEKKTSGRICIGNAETTAKERAGSLLEQFGITGNLLGYNYLIDMVIILRERKYAPDFVTEVYPKIASQYGTRSENIERNIRNAIEKAWRNTPADTLSRLYPCAINSERGKPTVKEFSCFIAKQIRETI